MQSITSLDNALTINLQSLNTFIKSVYFLNTFIKSVYFLSATVTLKQVQGIDCYDVVWHLLHFVAESVCF